MFKKLLLNKEMNDGGNPWLEYFWNYDTAESFGAYLQTLRL